MAKRSIYKQIVTPLATAGYVYLEKPDTKFDEVGSYRITITLSAADAAPIIRQLETAQDFAIEEARTEGKIKPNGRPKIADLPYKELDDGSVQFSPKCPAYVIGRKDGKRYDMRPAVFDGAGNRIDLNQIKVGTGSQVKVAIELSPFYTALVGAGVSLRLQAVQVIKAVEYGSGAGASAFGFGTDGESLEAAAASKYDDDDATSSGSFDEGDDIPF